MARNAGETSFLTEWPTLIPGCICLCTSGPASTVVPDDDDPAASPEPPVAAMTIRARKSADSAPPTAFLLRFRIAELPLSKCGQGPSLRRLRFSGERVEQGNGLGGTTSVYEPTGAGLGLFCISLSPAL